VTRGRRPPVVELTLLDGFELRADGNPLAVPLAAQRLLAFLALSARPVLRPHLAGVLWLESSDEHAFANLRSTLWRLRRCCDSLVDASGQSVRLASEVAIDVRRASDLAVRLVEHPDDATVLDADCDLLRHDLLPDWYDDWVLLERERYRQLRLRALDTLCDRLTKAGRLALAMEVGLASIAGEPLRESAHRAVIRIHLAEGNKAEAFRQYRLYRTLLHDQLGLSPSGQMEELVRGLDAAETIR
jgi:DNA-binding SARP family transcriptional activator